MDRRQKLEEILNSRNYDPFEIIGSLRVAISRCIINHYKVWIWGCGEGIRAFLKTLELEQVRVEGIVDIDPDKSVEEYLEYLRTYIENSSWKLKECDTANKYFYGGSLDKPEHIYIHKDDEVWLNLGCHVGDTIFSFFSRGLKAQHIFAVESNKQYIQMLMDNLNDYLYVVRKYPSYYAYSYRNFELVLYAVPKEKIALGGLK